MQTLISYALMAFFGILALCQAAAMFMWIGSTLVMVLVVILRGFSRYLSLMADMIVRCVNWLCRLCPD